MDQDIELKVNINKLKIRIVDSGCFFSPNEKNYYNMSWEQFIQMFMPPIFTYELVPENEKADICLFSIQLKDESLLRDNEVNIMICIENCKKWKWYIHYNKYGDYGNKKIDIYFYNHISKIYNNNINKVYKDTNFVSIPTIYPRINYFKMIEDYYYNHKSLNCSFKDKNFCLTINRSNLNHDITKFVSILEELGRVDNISLYDNKIKNISCYNAIELLEIFNQYKFIVTFENSYSDGYITEKIFNVFLSKSIPLYAGSRLAPNIFNPNSFINIIPSELNRYILDTIEYLSIHEEKYNEMINEPKINKNYNDEDYINVMTSIINKKLQIEEKK